MKASLFCSATLFSLATFAFPANLLKDIDEDTLAQITTLAAKIEKEALTKRQLGTPGFDADAQLISVTGDHEYRAPGPNDLRGPCPGLNSMANHGYLPRNGIASILDMTEASVNVFGMGLDIASLLSVYSAVMFGDLTKFSIGGPPKSGLLGGILLGEPQGLSRSHLRFEVDVSPTRADLYTSDDPVSLDLGLFEELMAKPLGPKGYDLTVMNKWRQERFHNSVATNGHYFAPPLMNIVPTTATYLFTYRFFANCSAEHPEGYLDEETMKTFQGVTGSKGGYQWEAGRERIPENWYRRALSDPYDLAHFLPDMLEQFTTYPDLLVIGGNTGEPNTFTGINIVDLTGGVFNGETLLEGNNLMCFALRSLDSSAPDILKGLVGNVLLAVNKLTNVLDPLLESLGCPELAKYDPTLFKKYPGAGDGKY